MKRELPEMAWPAGGWCRKSFTIACCGLVPLMFAGCDTRVLGSGENDASPADAGLPTAAPPSGSDAGLPIAMPCTDVTPEATTVYSTQETTAAPQGQGGVIEDGIYDLVSMAYYDGGGSSGGPDRETIRISGGGTRLEYISGEYRFSIALAMAPANGLLNDTEVCPADNSYQNMFVGPQYTAVPGQFITGNGGWLKVFNKRP